MTKDEGFNLLKVQTIILKVNLHCDGCKQKVKKLLMRIEGVYTVSIDAEQQKVTVTGNVHSTTLIKKLAKAGKPAHVWFQNNNQNPTKDGSKNKNTTTASNKDQTPNINLESLSSDDDDDDVCSDDDDDDDLNFLKQINENATLNGGGGGGGERKLNQSQTTGKIPNGSDQKGSNGLVGGINLIGGEAKNSNMRFGDMNLHQPSSGGFGGAPQMVKLQENQSHPSAMMMNTLIGNNHNMMQRQQPQPVMMYNRANQVPNYTGYYYPCPSYYPTPYVTTHQPESFSDESTSSCSVM